MSKRLIIMLMSIECFCISLKAQQNIDTTMIEVPSQKFEYTINKTKRSVFVSSFYISKYPESNKQYQKYLYQLNGNELTTALPNRQLLEKSGLDKSQIDFLTTKFYSSKDYYSYPMIGLSTNQILKYLEWKSDYIGKIALRNKGVEIDETMKYIDILKQQKSIDSIPIQTEYLITSDVQLISAYKYFTSKRNKESHVVESDGILKDLNILSMYSYYIGTPNDIDELILTVAKDSKSSNKVYDCEDGKTVKISGDVGENLKCNYNKEAILRPYRVWHIKI